MANILTTRAQDSFSSNRELLDFSEGIALLDPNENPFTLATMKFGRGTTGNFKHSWLTDELVPETDTTDTTTACVTAGTTLYVDNADRWAAGDIGKRNATFETFLVTAVNTTTGALTIVRDYGATSGAYTALAGTFADEDVLTIIGNAFEQGHQLPTEKTTTEVQMDNWCQEQRTPFGISERAAAAAVRGEADWPFQARKAGITHQRKLEYQNFFGHPMPGDLGLSSSGTGNDAPATAGGLWHFLTGGTGFNGTGSDRRVSNTEITMNEFLTFVEALFEYGSGRRICFCAPIFRTAMAYWGITKQNTFSTDTVLGMKVGRWQSDHGEIVFITHKMLKNQGGNSLNIAFFVDMDDVKWITYSNIGQTRFRKLSPYEATGKTIMQAEWTTSSCLEVKTPKKHGVIYGTSSYAA